MIDIPKNKQKQKGQHADLKGPVPIELQIQDNTNSKCELKRKHLNRTSQMHTIQFPQINLESHQRQFSIKGYTRQDQCQANNFQSTNEQEKYMPIIQYYDKKYLMRNFPLSYFQNVDLLFKMIGRKKQFINNTYKTQRNDKSNDDSGKSQQKYKQTERIDRQKVKPTEPMRRHRKIHCSTNTFKENKHNKYSQEQNRTTHRQINQINATMSQIQNKKETDKCYEPKLTSSDSKIERPFTNKHNLNNRKQTNNTNYIIQTQGWTNNHIQAQPKRGKQKAREARQMNQNSRDQNVLSNLKSKSYTQIGRQGSAFNIKQIQNIQQKQMQRQTTEISKQQIYSPVIANQQNTFRKSEIGKSHTQNVSTHKRGLKSQLVEMSKIISASKDNTPKEVIRVSQNYKQEVNGQQQITVQEEQKQNNNKMFTTNNKLEKRKEKQLQIYKKQDKINIRTKIRHQTGRNDQDRPTLRNSQESKQYQVDTNRQQQFIQGNTKQTTLLLSAIEQAPSALLVEPKALSSCLNSVSTRHYEQRILQFPAQQHQKLNLTPKFFIINQQLQDVNNQAHNISNPDNLIIQPKPLQKQNRFEVQKDDHHFSDKRESEPQINNQQENPLPIQQNHTPHEATKQNQTKNQDSINVSEIDHIYNQIVELGVNQNIEYAPKFSFHPSIQIVQCKQQNNQQKTQKDSIVPASQQIQQPQIGLQQTNNQIIIASHQNMSKMHLPFTESAHFFNFHETDPQKQTKEKGRSIISILSQQSSSTITQNLNYIKKPANIIEQLAKQTNKEEDRALNKQEQITHLKNNQILNLQENGRTNQTLNHSTVCIQLQPQIPNKYQRQDSNDKGNSPPIEYLPKPIALVKQPSCLLLDTLQEEDIERYFVELDSIICDPEVNQMEEQLIIKKISSLDKTEKEEGTIISSLSVGQQKFTPKVYTRKCGVITADTLKTHQYPQIPEEYNENQSLMEQAKTKKDNNEVASRQNINRVEDEKEAVKNEEKIQHLAVEQNSITEMINDEQYNNNKHEQLQQRQTSNIQVLPLPKDNYVIISDKFKQGLDTQYINIIQQCKKSQAVSIIKTEDRTDMNNFTNNQQTKVLEDQIKKSKQINLNPIPLIKQETNTTRQKNRRNVKMHKMYDINIINQLGDHNCNQKSTNCQSENIQNNIIQTHLDEKQKTIIKENSQPNQQPINHPEEPQIFSTEEQSNPTMPSKPNLDIKDAEPKAENVVNGLIEPVKDTNIGDIPKTEQKIIIMPEVTSVQQQPQEKIYDRVNQEQQPLITNIQHSSLVAQPIKDNMATQKQNSCKKFSPYIIQTNSPIFNNRSLEQFNKTTDNNIEKSIAPWQPQAESQIKQHNLAEKVQTTETSRDIETSAPINDMNMLPITASDKEICSKRDINPDAISLQQQCIIKTPTPVQKQKAIVKKHIFCQCEEKVIYSSDITEQNETCYIQRIQPQQQMQNSALDNQKQINNQTIRSLTNQNNQKLDAFNDDIIEPVEVRRTQKDAASATLNMKKDVAIQTMTVEASQQTEQLARISNFCINHGKAIEKLSDKLCKLNDEQWQFTMKVLQTINPNNEFITRLIDDSSIWLCTPHKQKHSQQTFRRFDISSLRPSAIQQNMLEQTVKRVLGGNNMHNNIKYYLEMLTGMPVLIVKQSCYHKLDNLYRHSNIFGFTYGQKRVWKIVGTVKNIKRPNEKRIKLEEVKSKKTIQISWTAFLEEFKYSVISCFALNYHLRSQNIPNRVNEGNSLTFGLNISTAHIDNKKIQCLLGVQFNCHEEIQGKMMIYGKIKGVSEEQRFKYLGSGDLALVSMRLKPGQYLIVIEASVQKEQITGGRLLMGCESSEAKIWLEDSWQRRQTDNNQ